MKNILIAMVWLLCGTASVAQRKPLRKQRFILTHGVGYDIPFQTIRVNPITDQLSDVNDKGISLLAFSATWFIKKNWGLEFLMQGVTSKEKDRDKQFNRLLEEKWTGGYFYNPRHYYSGGGLSRFMGVLGINYKIEKSRITYIPKFFIGSVSVYTPLNINHYLKERNTNTALMLNYQGDKISRGQLVAGPAFSITYRFNSIIGAGLNTSFLWHNVKMTYNEKITNLITNEVSDTYYTYRGHMQRLNIGAHVSIGFGRRGDLTGSR
ncbi:MAG: hypothetical protein KF862_13285 [Chitinophagaceae bacterium]|nr:hypothetical protein [Chitinophagaceae bacterium]